MQERLRHDRDRSPAETIALAFETLGLDGVGGESGYGAAAFAEATALASAHASAPHAEALADLLALPFVTIDNPDSRDLDQALHIAREPGGAAYRVRYALADAAHFAPPGSALFAAALRRGASYYAPGQVAPMLPRQLSEDLVSLGPGVVRRALVFDMRLDAEAKVLSTTVVRARIRSRAQLTYRGVQAFLDGEARADEPIEEAWAESLQLLRRVGTLLAARGRARGVVPFDRREVDVRIAPATARRPARFVARERERLDTEEWNAQLSLLCNTEGATLLTGLKAARRLERAEHDGLEPIYRVHEAPVPSRLRELRARLDAWVAALSLDERFRWRAGQSLADYVDGLPPEPREAARVRAVQRQILTVQRASEFRAEPGRHHALAVPGYARFSSPMREIVGIHVHHELVEALSAEAGGAPAADEKRQHAVIESANAARQRQKRLDKHIGFALVADLLEDDLERDPVPVHAGTVLGVRGGGSGHLYVGIDALALDLKVYAEDLRRRHGGDYAFEDFRAAPSEPGAGPHFLLGDAVGVRAVGYDEKRERFTLDIVPRGEAARRERRRKVPGR